MQKVMQGRGIVLKDSSKEGRGTPVLKRTLCGTHLWILVHLGTAFQLKRLLLLMIQYFVPYYSHGKLYFSAYKRITQVKRLETIYHSNNWI